MNDDRAQCKVSSQCHFLNIFIKTFCKSLAYCHPFNGRPIASYPENRMHCNSSNWWERLKNWINREKKNMTRYLHIDEEEENHIEHEKIAL